MVTAGPVINVRRGKFFVGASFMKGLYEYERLEPNPTLKDTNEKQDFDVVGGYYFHPNIGIFIGYKYARWHFTTKNVNTGVVSYTQTIDQYGPLVGLTANYPIGSSGFTPFVTYSHYFLRRHLREETYKFSETGPSIEAGLAYAFRSYTATAGYKYQNFYIAQDGVLSDVEARYKGFMFSLNRTF